MMRAILQLPETGIPILNRLLGRAAHPGRVEYAREIYLPGLFAGIASQDGLTTREALKLALANFDAAGILNTAREKIEAEALAIENIAAGITGRALTAASESLSRLRKTPNAANELAALDAEARITAADKVAASLAEEAAALRGRFAGSPTHLEALGIGLQAVEKALRLSPLASAVSVALRLRVALDGLENNRPYGRALAEELLSGRLSLKVDWDWIPRSWIERGTPPGFRWDEEDLVFGS